MLNLSSVESSVTLAYHSTHYLLNQVYQSTQEKIVSKCDITFDRYCK